MRQTDWHKEKMIAIIDVNLGQALTTIIFTVLAILVLSGLIRTTIEELETSYDNSVVLEVIFGIWGLLALIVVCVLAYYFPEAPKS